MSDDARTDADHRARLIAFIESQPFRIGVTALIIVNAITLGLETYPGVQASIGGLIDRFDQFVITIFVIEILLKIFAYRASFFKDGWRVFDLIVVAISVFPNAGPFTVLRAMRVMRVFHIMSVTPGLRRVVEALFRAIPGMTGILAVLGLIFYVASVMATKLFQESEVSEKFATLDASAITLFQVMTLEGWSENVMRPLLGEYGWAWLFFVPFITLTSFAVLNLFIAVIVDALQKEAFEQEEERDAEEREMMQRQHDELILAIGDLRKEVDALRQSRNANGD